jgi:vacuolar-type H+-ATPase subunit E/Vma4
MVQRTLLETMSQLAEQRRGEILAEAQKEADAICAAAEEECGKRREAALSGARGAMAEQVRQARERAAAEAEKQALVMQEVVVDEILERVEVQLAQVAERTDFASVLRTLLREAVEDATAERGEAESGEFVVYAPAAHARSCEEWLHEMGVAGAEIEEDASLRDGVMVEDRSHTYRIVNTLSGRYARIREEARALCLRRLFGERSGNGA